VNLIRPTRRARRIKPFGEKDLTCRAPRTADLKPRPEWSRFDDANHSLTGLHLFIADRGGRKNVIDPVSGPKKTVCEQTGLGEVRNIVRVEDLREPEKAAARQPTGEGP
jgi:hypothetical protein